jgi:hypothetical protein
MAPVSLLLIAGEMARLQVARIRLMRENRD